MNTEEFDELVALPYQLYNSLFLTLPFSTLSEYGIDLPLFSKKCKEGLEASLDPCEVIDAFFQDEEKKIEVLFLFTQLVERQILLFDAVERSAIGPLTKSSTEQLLYELKSSLPAGKTLRLVLTAHPTQFYPEVLLGLIEDTSDAVKANDIGVIRKLLLQLGRTSFRNPHPPTPLEEAEMLIDQFGDVFYQVFTDLSLDWKGNAPRLELGFWPGGDRDGNPNVTADATLKTCERLRDFALESLLHQIEGLRRRITFKGATHKLLHMRQSLQRDEYSSIEELDQDLDELLEIVDQEHDGLFREEIVRVKTALSLFGFHFASLDVRENSTVIGALIGSLESRYLSWSAPEKVEWLSGATPPPIEDDLVEVLSLVPHIQNRNGPLGLHRFVVSHTESSLHLLEIFYLTQWYAEGKLDVVPLFESIEDLRQAPKIMKELLAHKPYFEHVKRRAGKQTIMLGFSDGTKDGGYLSCNYEIQRCKELFSQLADELGIEIIFFDGRGGPPARGGGPTHKYYASLAEQIPLKDIQLTVQGQSISSQFGSYESASFSLVELLETFLQPKKVYKEAFLGDLAKRAHFFYQELRNDSQFIPLLMETTPIKLLGELNIASRPPKRADGKAPSLENLRAISFVGAWSLMKINVPAFYGLGRSLMEEIDRGNLEKLQNLYEQSLFFRVILGNAVQALRKSYLPLTKYTESDPEFGLLWKNLREEATRTVEAILLVTGKEKLQVEVLLGERSITLREQIVLPLLVIQHYALIHWRKDPENARWKKLLLKTIPPSINAARNSA